MGIKLKALQEERMGHLMVGRETCGVWYDWNVEKGVGTLLVWGYGMEKFPLCSGHVLEDLIVSARARR